MTRSLVALALALTAALVSPAMANSIGITAGPMPFVVAALGYSACGFGLLLVVGILTVLGRLPAKPPLWLFWTVIAGALAAMVGPALASPAMAGPLRSRAVCVPVHVEGVGTVHVCGLPLRRR